MVFLISEVDADYRSVLFGFHRRTRSQTAGAASTLLIRSALRPCRCAAPLRGRPARSDGLSSHSPEALTHQTNQPITFRTVTYACVCSIPMGWLWHGRVFFIRTSRSSIHFFVISRCFSMLASRSFNSLAFLFNSSTGNGFPVLVSTCTDVLPD